MGKRNSLFLFLVILLLGIYLDYKDFLSPELSLALAVSDDPSPRRSIYPWLTESARQLHRGHFPLWCNLEGMGMPLLANYQSAVFNPFHFAYEFFPALKLLDALILLKLVLLGLFTYLFASELGVSGLSAGFCGLLICFCGYVSMTVNQVNLNTELWVPAGLLMAEKILKRGASLLRFILLAGISALSIMGGNPEAAFYFLILILFYALFRLGFRRKKEILVIALALGSGFALSAVQFLSFLEYLGFGWHIHNTDGFLIDPVSLPGLFRLFFPGRFGPPSHIDHLIYLFGFLGLIPIFWALLTLAKIPQLSRPGIFFWLIVLTFLGLIYRLPPFSFLNQLPVLEQVRSFKYASFGVSCNVPTHRSHLNRGF